MTQLFGENKTIEGVYFFDLLDWVERSFRYIGSGVTFEDLNGSLALPPVQRTAVWNPRRIVDLWDSLLRGLPIGCFFLVPRHEKGQRRTEPDTDLKLVGPGFDLLDGQQRLAAMRLGVTAPAENSRCVWVNLEASSTTHLLKLYLTSESQPFGYNPDSGEKLSVRDRRTARTKLENDPEWTSDLRSEDENKPGLRDHQLFKHAVACKRKLPRPYNAPSAIPLYDLIRAWRVGKEEAVRNEINSWVKSPEAVSQQRFDLLCSAFGKLEGTQIGLIKVDPQTFISEPESGEKKDAFITLFQRIGAGGVPLNEEERLFSIYKHYQPNIHDLINQIYRDIGHVLPPTKIATAALRIANARRHSEPHEGNSIPGIDLFSAAMLGREARKAGTEGLAQSLIDLLPVNGSNGTFAVLFRAIYNALRFDEKQNPNGFPAIMLPELSPYLIQVLVFWALKRGGDIDSQRDDVIRFSLFWLLCVTDEDKATQRCFRLLKQGGVPERLPFLNLYHQLTVADPYALSLPKPDEVDEFVGSWNPSPIWRSKESRFPPSAGNVARVLERWWESSSRFLMWHQRAYLQKEFSSYDPVLTENDRPYDVDHIRAWSHWGQNWQVVSRAFRDAGVPPQDPDPMRHSRHHLGNSIGNLRLVDFSINRSDGDDSITKKLAFVKDEATLNDIERDSENFAFDPQSRDLWARSSGDGTYWTRDSLTDFQSAVERRSCWLYKKLYRQVGLSDWIDTKIAGANAAEDKTVSEKCSPWSDELERQTREALDPLEFLPGNGGIHLKSSDRRFGTVSLEDWLEGRLRIVERDEKEVVFSSVDDLLRAGWVVD